MLSLLTSIGDTFGVIVQFITSTITGIVNVFGLVGSSFIFLTQSVAFLPSVVVSFVLAGISIAIVFHLIGR